jgi:hypothetical protein
VVAVCPAAAVWAGCTKRLDAAAAPQNYAGRTNRAEWAGCTKNLNAAAAPLNYAGRTNRAEWAECTKPQSDRKEMKGAPRNRGALFVLRRVDRSAEWDEK